MRTAEKKGRYFVTAGERRRRALLLLLEQGEIQKNHAVECKVRDSEDATEISLTENVMREDMHPVDAYEAFSALADQGKAIPDIAARFGTTEIIVRRRLALAKVSPKLLDLYRKEEMTFEQLSAFTVSDDHERQEQVWNGLSTWDRHASRIKSNLLTDEVASTDRRVKFVGGLDASLLCALQTVRINPIGCSLSREATASTSRAGSSSDCAIKMPWPATSMRFWMLLSEAAKTGLVILGMRTPITGRRFAEPDEPPIGR